MERFDRSKTLKKQINNPKIVVIGGGTGLSTLLRGLKIYESDITAIVTVADNGGSSGMLRRDLKMLPPGDIRNCILALAETEPLMHDLLNYRFGENHGSLANQSFGNLFIAAMTGVCNNFYDAIRNMSRVLAVRGKVLPVSVEDINIEAILCDGSTISGECEIGDRTNYKTTNIESMKMAPLDAKPLDEACMEIEKADVCVFGPGSLYTSIIPNLLFPKIRQSILKSKAIKIYVGNIMTQPAETYKYDLKMHIDAINNIFEEDDCGVKNIFDYCIANIKLLSPKAMKKYMESDSNIVLYDNEEITKIGIDLVEAPLVSVNEIGAIRHNSEMLAELIMHIWSNKK